MCDIDGGERAEVFTWTFRIARKQHRCAACDGPINPGRRYGVLFTVFDGYVDSTKCCLPCHRTGEKFCAEHRFFPHPTGLSDALLECVDEEPKESSRWRRALQAMRVRRAEATP